MRLEKKVGIKKEEKVVGMTIKDVLKKRCIAVIKLKDEAVRDSIRVILSEFDRKSKNPSDEEAMLILKKLRKSELERLACIEETSSDFLCLIDCYLPSEVSEDDIVAWITGEVDFASLKNKMQAVGLVVKHFGAAVVDGKTARNIVEKF